MRPHPLSAPSRRRRGHTLVELAVVMATFALLLGGTLLLLSGARESWRRADAESRLQESGRRMLEAILGDLRRSGLTVAQGASWPAIFERPRGPRGTPRGALVATMDPADVDRVDSIGAVNGAGDRIERNRERVSDELVLQLPADLDGDGTPLDADGEMEWGEELVSWFVVEDAEGRPWLWRSVDRAGTVVEERVVGSAVDKATFDVVFNDRTLRFGEVAVVLYLEETDARGRRVATQVEGSVVLRNTREM